MFIKTIPVNDVYSIDLWAGYTAFPRSPIIPVNILKLGTTHTSQNGNTVPDMGLLNCNGLSCNKCPFSTRERNTTCKEQVIDFITPTINKLRVTNPEFFI